MLNRYYTMLTEGGGFQKKPAHLMTLEEYQSTVTPILTEYNKFIKKNFEHLASTDYGGIFFYTFPELLSDVKKGTQKGFMFRKGEYDKGLTDEEFARKSFSYRKTGKFDKNYEPAKTPEGLTEKKNEYINKLSNYFTEEEIVRLIDRDEVKSNKRSVKRAIDNDTYKKLLNEGKVTIEQIEKVAESVGVKLPKKIFSESLKKSMESQALYEKIYASMPSVNKQVLSKMVDDIKETFKPLEKIIYERETKRYEKSILETLEQKEADVYKLHDWLHFFDFVFKYQKQEERKHKEKDRYNRDITVTTHWIVGLSLKDGWKDAVSKAVLEEIETLKVNMIYSIIDNFQKITMPIESIEQVSLDVGAKGFEGTYKFKFNNRSSFVFKTEAIGAGGYNIQRYHFRYLTHFTDIILSDGTKVSNRTSIVEHFSDKEVSEKMFNPYFVVKKAETIEQIIDVFYNYFKSNYKYSNVRKSASKTDATVSYKINNTQRTKYFFLKRSDSLEENKKRAYSLLKELEVPKPDSFDSEKLEHGGGVSSFKSNLTEEQQKIVQSDNFISWFGDWRILVKAKSLANNIKGIYAHVFNIDIEQALFEISVQANSNAISKSGVTKSVGEEIVELALKLYPNAKLGDTYYPVVSKVVDEHGYPLVVYHGFLSYSKKDWFYEFNRLPAFFSTRRAFAEQYAETKSMDAGLDKDANSYDCFLNIKKLFDPNDKNSIELAKKLLPEKINVSHGTMWFLDADLDKEYVVEMMSGIQTIYPDHMTGDILKANVGDIIPEKVSMSQYEDRILLYKDEDWAYTVDRNYFNEKTEKEVADYVSRGDSYSRKSIRYKDKYFEPYVLDDKTYRMKPNEEPIAIEFRSELGKYRKNFIENINTLKRVDETDTHFEIPLKSYETLKNSWGGTISIRKRNLKSYKVKAKDNWTMFENETVQKFLTENDFGGWIAFEKGDKTCAVYKAENIKLADGTNTTFDGNSKDIRFRDGGNVTVNDSKIKILYLHGLGATPKSDNIEILERDGVTIISPTFDYRNSIVFDFIAYDIIEKHNIQIIIGHSLGGYLAYYLSNKYKIPCLMFNPSFGYKNLYLQPIPNDVKELTSYEKQTVVVGSKDVSSKNQLEFFKKTKAKIFTEQIDHDVPKNIKLKYFDDFLKRLFKEETMSYGGQISGKKNPYAICTVSLGKVIGTQKRSEWTSAELKKYESCVLKVKKTMQDGGGVSVDDGGQFTLLYMDEHGKNIVYSDKEGYKIAVNDPKDARYITLWYNGKRVGVLEAREAYLNNYHGHTGKFLTIAAAYIDKPHQSKGFGLKMYQVLREFSADDVLGFFSNLTDRQNKKVIPKIYSHFNNEIVGDYHIVTYHDGGIVDQDMYFAIYDNEESKHWLMVAKYNLNNKQEVDTVTRLVDKANDSGLKVKAITKLEYENYELGDEMDIQEVKKIINEERNTNNEYKTGGTICKCKFRDGKVPNKSIYDELYGLN